MTRLPNDDAERTGDTRPADDAPGTDARALDARLAALERAVGGGDPDRTHESSPDYTDLATTAETTARLDALEDRLDALEATTAELDAATQALRGYVGSIRSVNERVRARADRALAVATDAPTGPESRRADEDAGGDEVGRDGQPDGAA
ncbi:DUF7310 family coiled-coil domain-containing protein [Halobaculum marinum]|uniref:DUF7310 domain-containing protein n=1 Tax=Halobaculum marinum TaxID=3031996 RepID=A0ABD5X019_9EURY|nr:hypothetical protein [Halobaculum sp. DT55]